MIGDHLIGESLVALYERSTASWLDLISNISLTATQVTKSAVVGETPTAEFTPVFSPTPLALSPTG
jgi:hypothetical protein